MTIYLRRTVESVLKAGTITIMNLLFRGMTLSQSRGFWIMQNTEVNLFSPSCVLSTAACSKDMYPSIRDGRALSPTIILWHLKAVSYTHLDVYKRQVQGLQHHKFMISDQHLYVRHRHDLPEDLYPIRISVYHIAKDIQGVFRLKVDLL